VGTGVASGGANVTEGVVVGGGVVTLGWNFIIRSSSASAMAAFRAAICVREWGVGGGEGGRGEGEGGSKACE
jgi:hypothetical protein